MDHLDGDLLILRPGERLRIDRSETAYSYNHRTGLQVDLLELKKVAAARRQAPGDTEDTAFLERRVRG